MIETIFDDSGLQILNPSLCRVHAHVWVWTSDSGTNDPNPPDDWFCSCKRYQWIVAKR